MTTAARDTFPWTRLWVPANGRIRTDPDGFLLDPSEPYTRSLNPEVVTFDAIAPRRCLVLLGEPGIGKSFALRSEAAGLSPEPLFVDLKEYGSEERLYRAIFESERWRRWIEEPGTVLTLFIDALDEGLVRIASLSELLPNGLRRGPAERLRVRLSCRTADWPSTLTARLEEIFGASEVGVFELTPLRARDVSEAARAHGLDATAFLAEVRRQHVGALAARPVTLLLLLRAFERDGRLARTRAELYGTGCLYLAEEPDVARREAARQNQRFTLTAAERLAVAARIAAATLLSNRAAVSLSELPEDVAPDDLSVSELAGGEEQAGPDGFPVTEQGIRETLRTGLFTSRGVGRLGWAHQTYAEYLAARYLSSRSMAQITSLLGHSDDSGSFVIPQLAETAAWLASLREDVLEWLMGLEPDLLVRTDISAATPGLRERVVETLLEQFREERMPDEWEYRRFYDRLAHPGLADQLGPVIRDGAQGVIVRRVAIDIAEACRLTSLLDLLVSVALAPDENQHVREQAAQAIVTVGDTDAKMRLLPLARGELGSDPTDQLRGITLRALWPRHLSAADASVCLTAPKDEFLVGQYAYFLEHELVPGARDEDLPALIEAARRWTFPGHEPHSLSTVVHQLVARGLTALEVPGLLPALAALFLHRLRTRDSVIEDHARTPEESEALVQRRRAVARIVLNETDIALDDAYMLVLRPLSLGSEADALWMLDEVERARPERQAIWARALWYLVRPPVSANLLTRLLEVAGRVAAVAEQFDTLINAWPLGSEIAQDARRRYEREQAIAAENVRRPERAPATAEEIERAVAAVTAGDAARWPTLVYALARGENGDPALRAASEPVTALPGWAAASSPLRERVIQAAQHYARVAAPPGTSWIGTGQMPSSAAYYYAAWELALTDAHFLDSVSEDDWRRFAPIVVGHIVDTPRRAEFACRAFACVPDEVLAWVERRVRGPGPAMVGDVLELFAGCWDARLSALGLALAGDPALPPPKRLALTEALVDRGVPEALDALVPLLTLAPDASSEVIERGAEAGALLLLHDPAKYWPAVWSAFRASSPLASRILAKLSDRTWGDRARPWDAFTAEQLGELYLWMSQQYGARLDVYPSGAGVVGETEKLRELRDAIMRVLITRGSPEAVRVMSGLVAALPEQWPFIRWRFRETLTTARRAQWAPVEPRTVLALLRHKELRYVESEEHLRDVVLESLARLQDQLQGENPAAENLWNYQGSGTRRRAFRPKDEEDLSGYIARWIRDDVNARGLVVNREVQPRRGQKTDIHVTARPRQPQAGSPERLITVVVEVKGCWNPEWRTGLRTQLVDRYLLPNGLSAGIFVVGMYACEAWTRSDPRRRRVPRLDMSAMRDLLLAEARALETERPHLRLSATVLDVRLGLGSRSPAAPPRRRGSGATRTRTAEGKPARRTSRARRSASGAQSAGGPAARKRKPVGTAKAGSSGGRRGPGPRRSRKPTRPK